MQMQPLHPQAQPVQAVYGLHIHDGRFARLTKRVLTMALLSAVITIIGQAVRIMLSQDKGIKAIGVGLLGMLCSLLVPCCGYFGAKNSDTNLTCLFCGCNCLASVIQVIGLASSGLAYVGFKFLLDNCDPSNVQSACSQQSIDWVLTCQNLGHPVDTAQQCYDYFDTTLMGSLMTALVVGVIVCIPTFILQCLSFFFGKQLYDALQAGQVLHVAPRAPLMVAVPGQPVQATHFQQP